MILSCCYSMFVINFQDPASSIPKGTLLALLISMISYAAFVVIAGGAAIRDASGNVADLVNGTVSDCLGNCSYGLHNSYAVSYHIAVGFN